MSLAASEESRFYDEVYRRHLAAPDAALICNRLVLLKDLADPRHPIFERRLLFRAAFERLLEEPLAGSRVLDYGCGTGDWGLVLAGEGARVTFLDLSPVAVRLALRRAQVSGVAERVRGVARDASDLTCFADGEFDLIFASAALHHTLKYAHALEELVRVLKAGGRLVLAETLGNNPVLNGARRARAWLSREPVEAGEGILFGEAHLEMLRRCFTTIEVYPLNLVAMLKRLFRGRFYHAPVRGLVTSLEWADRLLLAAAPRLRRYCGEALIVARK